MNEPLTVVLDIIAILEQLGLRDKANLSEILDENLPETIGPPGVSA